ncbi:MAG: NADH-quinone oxidoreductase subunit NuoE [Pseudomonadales bacterium]|jgi:NADH-quinone oxidoreductase subunit E|nr:NADH-quinone oxidoreductase subunit NuoE [Pseudomonadales bacterium]MDP7359248.1 NADH-quinone oxidoreductase subunit NuoE [Pseudomonadales bacterium]MDP7596421.1 NADH-quinone oxidoreductase subunit NuoE [Pseudomonadales bacterium]HJN50152.1 NADH-quinone oxidoreductase subunit NuoE [Pseudomonadales bacterium]|tara:strand:- start:81 stop:569 length:489 start_codon:yes stop_codon:yes gene_type:complete
MSAAEQDLIQALSDEEIGEIEKEITHLNGRKSAAIDALKIVQKHRRYVSDESLQAVANLLGMSFAELDGIATFYNLIFRKPVGEKVILLCDSVSCWIMGGVDIREKIKSKLQIEMGETTPDDKYTLLPMSCLGDCDHAPAMIVGEDVYRDLTNERIDEIFDE